MRRRFGRGRKRNDSAGGNAAPIDAAGALRRIEAAGLASELSAVELDGVSPAEVALGSGKLEGDDVLLGFSPRDGGAALFGALALARSKEEFAGRVLAIAPQWNDAARHRLGVLGELPFSVRAVTGGGEDPQVAAIAVQEVVAAAGGSLASLSRGLRAEDARVLERALASLDGLAAKHGGVVHLGDGRADLVLLAARVATLARAGGRVRLEIHAPERSTHELAADGLATAFDRLEGALRKRLNDRRVRGSEAALRASLLPLLDRAAEFEARRVWPLLGGDAPELDAVGIDAAGRFTVAVARERFGLAALGAAVDGAFDPRLRAPFFHRGLAGEPQLLLAGTEFDAAALAVLGALALPIRAFDVSRRGQDLRLEPRESVTPAAIPAARAATPPPSEPKREAAPEAPADAGVEEMSLFDLDDEGQRSSGEGEGRRRRSRGGRRRGRRNRSDGDDERGAEKEDAPETAEAASGEAAEAKGEGRSQGRSRRGRRRGRGRESGESSETVAEPPEAPAEDDGLVDDDELAQLADDAPELEVSEDLSYEDEDTRDEGDDEADQARKAREIRRRARVAKAEPEPPKPPRRRAAFVAHADRISVLTAVLLARDVRLVEGFWVYPQEDLMTFFRSIATDLREETPIFLVGFNASPPARDTLQAASLYSGRLHWFDHHVWPPEDLETLRASIGEDAVHIDAGAESSLAAVIAERTRRSRFSDKLVELATGRFTQHDYERWGRLWWHRAGEIAKRRGERRADVEPLLVGRPSDLAKEAADIPAPDPPAEVAFVSGRDFRLVHFGGYVMVVLEVPEAMDLHLAARVARERYEAQLSLAYREGGELLVIGGDDSRAKRGLDLGSMAEHLASKHDWITSLRDDDHVARVLVRDLQTVPGRLDEVVGEIAMGRSIVEG